MTPKVKRISWQISKLDTIAIRCGITGGEWSRELIMGMFAEPEVLLALINLTLSDAMVTAGVKVGEKLYCKFEHRTLTEKVTFRVQHLTAKPMLIGGPDAMLTAYDESLVWKYWANWRYWGDIRPETVADPKILAGGMEKSDAKKYLLNLLDKMDKQSLSLEQAGS